MVAPPAPSSKMGHSFPRAPCRAHQTSIHLHYPLICPDLAVLHGLCSGPDDLLVCKSVDALQLDHIKRFGPRLLMFPACAQQCPSSPSAKPSNAQPRWQQHRPVYGLAVGRIKVHNNPLLKQLLDLGRPLPSLI